MNNILYLSYDGLTDPLGQSQVLPYLVYLSQKGYRFTILSFEKADWLEKEGAVIRGITANAGIRWVPLSFTSRPPVLAKAWDRWRMKQVAFSLQRKYGYSMVHCRSYVAAEVGLELKKAFGTKLLFDMRGFWADEKVDNGQWNQQRWLYRRLYKHYKEKEREFLLSADAIVSLTEAAQTYLLQQPGYQHLPITVIPCCADLTHFDYQKVDASEISQLRKDLCFKEEHKVLVYLGSLGGWYLTSEMFCFFNALKRQRPEYKMLVLTKDPPARILAEAALAGVNSDDLRVTYASRSKLPVFLAACSASVFFIRDTFSKMASSPTKHAELMGMGLPVICNAIGDIGNIIQETGSGFSVESFEKINIEKAVKALASLECISKESIREAATQYFDLSQGVAAYASVYQHIIQQSLSTA